MGTNINSNKAIPRLIEPLSVAPISKKRQKTLKLSHENPSDPSVCGSRHKKFGSFQGEISPKISKVEKDESIEKDEESKEDDMRDYLSASLGVQRSSLFDDGEIEEDMDILQKMANNSAKRAKKNLELSNTLTNSEHN